MSLSQPSLSSSDRADRHSGGILQPRLVGGLAAFALLCREDGRPQDWDAESAMNGPQFPMLIQFASCRAGQSSIGQDVGGTWVTALLKVLAASHDISWKEWFDRASGHMTLGPEQTPQWVELGPVTDAFRRGKVLV